MLGMAASITTAARHSPVNPTKFATSNTTKGIIIKRNNTTGIMLGNNCHCDLFHSKLRLSEISIKGTTSRSNKPKSLSITDGMGTLATLSNIANNAAQSAGMRSKPLKMFSS